MKLNLPENKKDVALDVTPDLVLRCPLEKLVVGLREEYEKAKEEKLKRKVKAAHF